MSTEKVDFSIVVPRKRYPKSPLFLRLNITAGGSSGQLFKNRL